MNWPIIVLNLLIPSCYIWISELLFSNHSEEEKSRFLPYIFTLLIFVFHVSGVFIYAKLKKKKMKWTFLNFILLMIALGVNIFIFEQFLFEK